MNLWETNQIQTIAALKFSQLQALCWGLWAVDFSEWKERAIDVQTKESAMVCKRLKHSQKISM
jgi:hypothetical protein